MAKKTKSQIGADRVKWETQTRFNPIQNLTPLSLSAHLDAWERGDIKNLARVWDVMARRDLRLSGIIPKRLKAPSRRKWSIGYVGAKTPAAEKQKEIVEYALRNATLKRADDGDVQEKFSGVIRSMMNAVAYKYAPHEIVWKPTPKGITFDAIYVPLWFFERKESKLRYLETPHSPEGIDLKPGEWLTMVGDGLMEPSSIAYMFKSLPLKDWLAFTDKFGVPGVVVKTDATPGSTEWDEVNLAVESYGTDMALVVSRSGTEFDFPGAKVGDGGAMQNLVEYCDRAMAVIWRGGDLSTMSQKGDSNGSMMQMEERATLEGDDCERVEATINQQLLPWIVKFGTGDDDVLVEFKIDVSDLSDTDQSLNIDRTLHNMGMGQSKEDIATRYGRNLPDDGDDVLKTPQEISEEERREGKSGNTPHVEGLENDASKENRRQRAEEEILANEFDPNQDRDERGRWTAIGMHTDVISESFPKYKDVYKRWDSETHRALRKDSKSIDDANGLETQLVDCIGDFDGSMETSILTEYRTGEIEDVIYVNAVKGVKYNQIGTIVFEPDEGGEHRMVQIRGFNNADEPRQHLAAFGLKSRTLVPEPNGKWTANVMVDGSLLDYEDASKGTDSQALVKALKPLAGKQEIDSFKGTVYKLGDFETFSRENGVAAQRRIIEDYESKRRNRQAGDRQDGGTQGKRSESDGSRDFPNEGASHGGRKVDGYRRKTGAVRRLLNLITGRSKLLGSSSLANENKNEVDERFEEMAVETSVGAVRTDFAGIAQLIAEAMQINDPALQRARLAQIVENMDVPESPELEAIIERAMKAALVNGFGEMAS